MRNFDLAFSLGFSCGCSRALRAAGLQFASYPLDWTGSPGIVESARMIASDFAGWLERDDLEVGVHFDEEVGAAGGLVRDRGVAGVDV